MKMMLKSISLLVTIYLLSGCQLIAQSLNVQYGGPWGIQKLTYGNETLIDLSKKIGRLFTPESYKASKKGGGEVVGWSHLQSHTWDHNKKEYTANFIWGNVICAYRQMTDTLYINIRITNTSQGDIFNGLSFSPLSFVYNKRPDNFQEYFPYYTNNISSPGFIRAQLDAYHVTVENPLPDKKVYVGFMEEKSNNGSLYKVWTGNHPYNGMQDFDPAVQLKLQPGKSFEYTIAIRFSKPNATIESVAAKSLSNFRTRQPVKIAWKDRRPIGELYMSSYTGTKYENNARNWSVAPLNEINIKTAAGQAAFRNKVLEFGRRSIVTMKDLNAQGVIVWDIEGQEYPHPYSYIGSPELLEKLAPEMNVVADQFFNLFRRAGFKTGICIRPDSVVFNKEGNWIEHLAVKDPVATMLRKIKYAKKRWCCSIFYVDTNVDEAGKVMDYSIFKKLAELCPDVLIIPEHERISYYAYTAPFSDLKFENVLLEQEVKSIYPEAFKVINVPEGLKSTEAQNIANLVASLKQGNIFLFRPWFNDQPTNGLIKKAWKIFSENKERR